MSGRIGSLFIEEVAAADLVECGQILVPTGDDFAHRRVGLELLNGGIIADEEKNFGEMEMVGIFFGEGGGDIDANAHRTQGKAVSYADADAAAVLAGIQAADGNEWLIHEVDAGKAFCVEHRGDFFAVDPGGAEFFEWRFGAAADGDARVLKNLEAGIEQRAFQRAQVGGGGNPLQSGAFEEIVAMPVFHGDHVELNIDVIFRVQELG